MSGAEGEEQGVTCTKLRAEALQNRTEQNSSTAHMHYFYQQSVTARNGSQLLAQTSRELLISNVGEIAFPTQLIKFNTFPVSVISGSRHVGVTAPRLQAQSQVARATYGVKSII